MKRPATSPRLVLKTTPLQAVARALRLALTRIPTRLYLTIGLASMVATMLMTAAWLGLVPDAENPVRAHRAALAETTAIASALQLDEQHPEPLADTAGAAARAPARAGIDRRAPRRRQLADRDRRPCRPLAGHARRRVQRKPADGAVDARWPHLGPHGVALRAAALHRLARLDRRPGGASHAVRLRRVGAGLLPVPGPHAAPPGSFARGAVAGAQCAGFADRRPAGAGRARPHHAGQPVAGRCAGAGPRAPGRPPCHRDRLAGPRRPADGARGAALAGRAQPAPGAARRLRLPHRPRRPAREPAQQLLADPRPRG